MNRVVKTQKMLAKWGVDALIVTNPLDLLYLSGIEMSAGMAYIGKNEAYLLVDGRYLEKCQKQRFLKVVKQAPGLLAKLVTKKMRLGFDQLHTSYAVYCKIKDEVTCQIVPLNSPVEQIRAIKEADEIKALQKSAHLLTLGFDFLTTRLRQGVSEKTLAKELELFWLTHGADRLAFDPIIAFGKNSSMPHYRAGSDLLRPNEAVLVDIGVMLDGYASDMTRMLFFGKPDPRMAKIYDIVLAAQTKAIKQVKPKANCAKLYETAFKVIDKAGFGPAFMHGLGHGIGVDVHEYPTLRATAKEDELEVGMCVTIEPGIYLPNIGGVRIEDMVLVTKDGHEVLTNCPKTMMILPVV